MALDLLSTKGTPLERQRFTWRELVQPPYSKLDDDAFTRVRVIVMNGLEAEAVRFSHACARANRELQPALARVRRLEQHQQTLVNWLNPSDQSPLETTVGIEQAAIEVTASVAHHEPDRSLAQVYRFGLLENVDHLYRFSALMDRLEGRDANSLLQSYTDVRPGRPTSVQHRAPEDELRRPYDRRRAALVTKLNALTVLAIAEQARAHYMTVGPTFSDPLARQLYAEIASLEEQHITQYESIADTRESWLEKWLLHEAAEVYNYWSCVQSEQNPRLGKIWARLLDYELGHLQFVRALFEKEERRDAAEVLAGKLPDPIPYRGQRAFVRQVLEAEVDLRARGAELMPKEQLPRSSPSPAYAIQLNAQGSPSEMVAEDWIWTPGTELVSVEEARPRQQNGHRRAQ